MVRLMTPRRTAVKRIERGLCGRDHGRGARVAGQPGGVVDRCLALRDQRAALQARRRQVAQREQTFLLQGLDQRADVPRGERGACGRPGRPRVGRPARR